MGEGQKVESPEKKRGSGWALFNHQNKKKKKKSHIQRECKGKKKLESVLVWVLSVS